TYLFGGASIAAGILDLVWGEFEANHQPIGALGDHVPGQVFLAYFAAALLVSGGVAVCLRRTTRAGAIALGIVYLEFALFWLPRLYTAPRALGFRFPVMIGLAGGIFMQLILVAAALILYAMPRFRWRERVTSITRWTFGLATISFGLVHLTGVATTARMIPKWMPLTPEFWTVLTGIAFMLAGLAILARVLDLLAARMLALMLLLFDVLVLVRLPLSRPQAHVAWGANAYNLAAAGAVWIFAESIARWRSAPGFQRTSGAVED
ncbi:MAG: hypothetical protein M3Y72_07190, partial [Acidobacteriota bacterium]|nr:hypothetical protein [Acidobacteriota bacterium]